MSSAILSQPSRILPSIDWVALGGFGPPALRELGILKDDDEYTRNIRWRAGFHTALAIP